MSDRTKALSTDPYAGGGVGSLGDLVDEFAHIPANPAWMLRKMQRLVAAHAHDAADCRELLDALALDHTVPADAP